MLKRIATASIVLAVVASGAAFAAARSMGTTVALHKESGVGKVLATSTGRTLYLYTPDGKNVSNCTGQCIAYWPPLITKGKPIAGMGVKKKLLGKIKRGAKYQVTYNGHPLYKYTGDSTAGQAYGEGQDGTWYVVTAAGAQK